MGALSPVHLIIVLVVALLVLGPGKLPETGEALGKAVRDFRRAMADDVTSPSPTSASGHETQAASDPDPGSEPSLEGPLD